WDRGDENRLRHPGRPMPADVSCDLAATRGVTDQGDVAEVERLDELRQVVGVRVHVIARRRLARPPVPASVVCNHAEAILREEEHLPIPRIAIERPAVGKEDDGALPPVLVVDLCAVLRDRKSTRLNSSHVKISYAVFCLKKKTLDIV